MNPLARSVFLVSTALVLCWGGLWWYEQSRQLPVFSYQTVYGISTTETTMGQLVAYDPTQPEPFVLTSDNLVVSEYTLFENRQQQRFIYYLAVPKQSAADPQLRLEDQRLYVRELDTGKRRRIRIPREAQLTRLVPQIVNDRLYFEGQNQVWSYSLRRNQWDAFYADQPLMDISLSERSQLLVGANPVENFGYVLWPLQPGESSAVGNFYENFGFAPSGTQFMLKQRPNQEVFSNDSFITVFSADGTSQDILNGFGNVVQALWKSEQEIIAIVRDEALVDSLVLVSLDDPNTVTELVYGGIMQSVDLINGNLWMVIQQEEGTIDYDQDAGIEALLESFAALERSQSLWSYTFESDELTEWPIEVVSPRQFEVRADVPAQ